MLDNLWPTALDPRGEDFSLSSTKHIQDGFLASFRGFRVFSNIRKSGNPLLPNLKPTFNCHVFFVFH